MQNAKGSAAPVRRPSIRDVALRAGVSAGCVSNVINRKRRQDDPIGRAVLQAVNELGYRANSMAANLRRSESRFVGVVLPDFENPFFGALLSSLERCAEASGYRLTPATSREDPEIEAREVAELLGWRVAGVLVAPTIGSRPLALAGTDVPVVLVDRVSGALLTDEVSADSVSAAREVTERLIAAGHRKIVLGVSDPKVPNMSDRIRGVEMAAAAAGLGVVVEQIDCGLSLDSAQAAFETYLDREGTPGAVFALQNLVALAAYGALIRRGLRPGIDLALASFDDSAWMAQMHPAVTAVAQPVDDIARAAWASLLARINGDAGPPRARHIPCRLMERGTLTPPPRPGGG